MRLLKRSIVLVLLALAGPGHAATRAEFPGGWYAEILPRPNAQSVVLIGNSHLESSVAGRVDLPNGQNVLFTRIGPGCFGGQGHVDGGGWVWNGGWSNRGIAHGVSPLIFRPGTCDPLIATPAQGSQGYRFIDDAGRAWTGDETYADRVNQIWEWTRRGNIACGQGPEHGYHCLIDGRRVQIVEGFVWFTRFNRAGDELAFAWVAPREGYAGTLLMTVAELDALPTYVIPGTVPPPPPPPPPPPQQAPDLGPFLSYADQRWRELGSRDKSGEAQFDDYFQIIGEWHHTLGHTDVGLLIQSPGRSNHKGFSEDYLCARNAEGVVFSGDVIIGGGAPGASINTRLVPTREARQEAFGVPPVPHVVVTPPPPPPPPPPTTSLEPRVRAIEEAIRRDRDALRGELDALAAKLRTDEALKAFVCGLLANDVAASVSGRTATAGGFLSHSHQITPLAVVLGCR